MSEGDKKAWQVGLAELRVPPFTEKWESVGPKHPEWNERIKLEIHALGKYIEFLRSEGSKPWFYIKPDTRFKGVIWRGYITLPTHPDLKFDMIILLSGEYPRAMPKAFIEDSLIELAGSKIYVKNRYPPPSKDDPAPKQWPKDPETGKSFVMICHDHMSAVEGAWAPNLGIVHFFIREVWFWFAAMQNVIIREHEKRG
nr:hypothetical protein [Candidatus Sigynarchaeota archaeon]